MPVRTSPDPAVAMQVVHVLALAAQQAQVFAAQERLADELRVEGFEGLHFFRYAARAA